ncbi:MAG TPA: 3-oxoacid CoA-transferase, partial [Spirochaetota bacterium]|nr:3-oxoacid CoA-transferase [Spirochaetota bacterium]
NIIFVGAMNARSKIAIENGEVKLIEPGIHKYVEKVDEITFSAKEALRLKKNVYYVTPLCAFRLTEKGLELCQVAPGVDIEKDIIANSGARINLPEDGKVKVIDSAIVTGKGFALDWRN